MLTARLILDIRIFSLCFFLGKFIPKYNGLLANAFRYVRIL